MRLIGKIDGYTMLLVAAALITLAGVVAEWIHFPLSAPVKGLDWRSADDFWPRRFPAAPFAIAITGALVFLVRGKQRTGTWLLALALAALLALPVYALFLDSTWLEKYVADTVQHVSIRRFVQNFIDVPNTGIEFYLADADVFEYLPDRLRIAFAMLGWGWGLAVVGTGAIVLILRRKQWLSSWRTFLRPLALICAALVATGASTLAGEFRYRQADQRLALGNYAGALDSYSTALRHDPTLGLSDVFLLKVSKGYYQVGGAAHPYAQLYLASSEASARPESAEARLASVTTFALDAPVGARLARMMRRKVAELWLRQALMHYKQGRMSNAALGLRQVLDSGHDWRHARFYLGRVLAQLHEFDQSARLYESLVPTLHNPSTKADVYNALGDVYAAAGDPLKARAAYGMAYSLDNKGNLWAVKGLSGT